MAHMDFPAVQKTLSHVTTRPPSMDSSEPNTPVSDSGAHEDYEKESDVALTPQVSNRLRPAISRSRTNYSTASSLNRDPSFEIDWEDDDPGNPRNWSMFYKGFIIFAISLGTLVVVLYSTSYTTGISQMQEEFHATEPVVTLGVVSLR